MGLARPDLRARVYAASSIYGFARTADAIHRDGIFDPTMFLDNSSGFTGDGVYQYRPTLTGANRVKMGLAVEGGIWVHAQGPYTDALSALDYEAVGLMHPDDFNDCIRRAPRHVYLQYYWPLGWHTDNDFADSAVTTWTDWQVNTVCTKNTTGGVSTQAGQTGPRNLVLTNSGSNGYTSSSSLYVQPGDQLFHGAIGRVTSGYTGSYVLYDITNATALETVTFTASSFQRIAMTTTIPDGCYEVVARPGGVESGAVTEWDCLFGHLLGRESGEVLMPSWLTEDFQLLSFGPAEYGRQVDDKIWNATSRRIEAYYEHQDWEALTLNAAATPMTIQVNRRDGLEAFDYWILAQRPYSDFESLEDETGETTAPEDLIMAAVWFEYFSTLHEANKDASGNSEWLSGRDEKKQILDAQRIARKVIQPRRQQTVQHIGLRRGGRW